MQKLLYPYLPEGMRNPETFQWMMNNPEYRAQLEEVLSKQVGCSTPTPIPLVHLCSPILLDLLLCCC